MDVILDYSRYVEDSRHFTVLGEEPPLNVELFSRRGWCPFCRQLARHVANESENSNSAQAERLSLRHAWQCSCGWWQTHYCDRSTSSGSYWEYNGARSAILDRYDPSDSGLPIIALRKALVRRPDLIDRVDRKKTEELVCSIFGDYFECETKLVGRSGDGGIDLVLVSADKTTLVQVKHRDKGSHNWTAEPVSTVREFLGAMLLADGRHGILVTTAHHFSPDAKDAAAKALTLDGVLQYDLLDGSQLFETLKLTNDRIQEYWREAMTF
jgi:hypothetical protein